MSLLVHWYGYTEEQIGRLTIRQFNDRMKDVGEIANMLQGHGKGRVRRDHARWIEWFDRRGQPLPPGWRRSSKRRK